MIHIVFTIVRVKPKTFNDDDDDDDDDDANYSY